MKHYFPNPIDTSGVKINKTLEELMEELSRNTHEVWAKQRLADGWVHGPKRDDEKKHHPDLVPYDELAEGEKRYDRETAYETLRVILKLGYTILDPASTISSEQQEEADKVRSLIESQKNLKSLLSIWHKRSLEVWKAYPDLYLLLGQVIKRASEPLLSYDIFSEGVESLGGIDALRKLSVEKRKLAVILFQQKALALANCGAIQDANTILQVLESLGVKDSETMGILGRTWKDLAQQATSHEIRQELLTKSYESYYMGFTSALAVNDIDGSYYTGINAATIALLSNRKEDCLQMVERVKTICRELIEELTQEGQRIGYWLYATLGEAYLLQGNISEASEWYSKAVELARETSTRALGAMRNQARIILVTLQLDQNTLDDCFNVPSVVLFSGHMFDRPDRYDSRFPVDNEEIVRRRIRQWLEKVNAGIGYASAACGADLIFLEEMLRRSGEVIIALPFDVETFIEQSIGCLQRGGWEERFKNVLAQASEIKILSQFHPETQADSFLFTNIYLHGRASLCAQNALTELESLLVWDGKSGDGDGGTSSMANIIQYSGNCFTVIPPDCSPERNISVHSVKDEGVNRTDLLAEMYESRTSMNIEDITADHHLFLPLLFADVKGYSRLNEKEALRFSIFFMGELADVLQKHSQNLLGRRSQGDSLFLVFKNIKECTKCALELKDRIRSVDWAGYLLPEDLSMRISLDVGPVYSYIDPVTDRMDFCGDYVVRAARLEPVTPPGSIYASETFVAVATSFNVRGVKFDYAGQVELPKGRGMMQAFCVGEKS